MEKNGYNEEAASSEWEKMKNTIQNLERQRQDRKKSKR